MKINKTRYDNAKKQIRKLLKYRKVVEDWEKALKDCPFREHVIAIDIADDGSIKMECVETKNLQNEKGESNVTAIKA